MVDRATLGFRLRRRIIRFVERFGVGKEFVGGFLQYPFL